MTVNKRPHARIQEINLIRNTEKKRCKEEPRILETKHERSCEGGTVQCPNRIPHSFLPLDFLWFCSLTDLCMNPSLWMESMARAVSAM